MTRLEQYLHDLQRFGIRPGLERIRALLARADHPEQQYPIVLVGGTNGKGSTCEFLARLLAQDGKQVGLYTSPHLYRWNERLRVLGNAQAATPAAPLFPGAISDAELDALFDEALPHIQAIAADEAFGQPTEFEVLTLLGFLHFARQNVDAAVIEVGLGGRFDATNVCQPTVSVVTHVALDHCDRLGHTVQEIARDKVHIARAGRVLVTAETKPEVLEVFREHCDLVKATLQIATTTPPASFQEINFHTARAARAALYQTLGWTSALSPSDLSPQALHVPARLEAIREQPLVLLDGANNPDGARTLAAQLQKLLAARPGAKLILVLGILADKDWQSMIAVLAPLAHTVIATQSHSQRAARAALVAEVAQAHCPRVETSTPVTKAVALAMKTAQPHDIICVTGSFYTVAEVDRDEVATHTAQIP